MERPEDPVLQRSFDIYAFYELATLGGTLLGRVLFVSKFQTDSRRQFQTCEPYELDYINKKGHRVRIMLHSIHVATTCCISEF